MRTFYRPRRDITPRPRLAGVTIALAAGVGLLIGASTLSLQEILPGAWVHLANSGAVWVVGAFGTAAWRARDLRQAAILGLVVLVGAVVGYYGTASVIGVQDFTAVRGPAIWSGVALVAGPVFGVAGLAYSRAPFVPRVLAMALLAGVFIGEALYLLVQFSYVPEAIITGALGFAIPFALGRTGIERWWAAGGAGLLGAAFLGAMLVLARVVDALFLA